MAGVVVGGPATDRVPRGPRLGRGQHLVHVADPGAERGRTLGPVRVVVEQVPVLLHRRAAAGHVGHHVVDVQRLERGDGAPRPAQRLLLTPGVQLQRAAAPLVAGHDHVVALRGQHPCGGRVDPVEEHVLHAAGQQRHPAPSGTDGRGVHRQPGERLAHRDRRQQRLHRAQPAGQPVGQRGDGRHPAQLLVERPGQGGHPQPALVREQREDRLPEQPVVPRPGHVALQLWAHRLQQPVVLHAGRAGGHAGHAAQAGVDVLRERPSRPISPFSARFIR